MDKTRFSVRAIIRDFIPGAPLFMPGRVASTIAQAFRPGQSENKFLFVAEDPPHAVVQSVPGRFLEFRSYLCPTRSISEFWFLQHRRRLSHGESDCFVNMQGDHWFLDERPLRFESMGEVYYFVEERKLKMNDFMLAHTEYLVLPQFVKLRH